MPKPYSQRRIWDPLTDGTLANNLILDLCPSYGQTVVPYLSSGKITRIDDRSTQANHFVQATGAAQPVYTASDANYGGRASMVVAGGQAMSSSANMNGISGIGAGTICLVQRFAVVAGTTVPFITSATYPTTNGTVLVVSGTTLHQVFRGSSQVINVAGSTPVVNTTYRSVLTVDLASATATAAQYVNNVLDSSASTGAGTPNNFQAAPWTFGGANATFMVNGSFARVMAWSRILTAGERTQLDDGLRSFFLL